MRSHLLGAICLMMALGTAYAADPSANVGEWRTYVEPQYGTRVEYPASVFSVAAGPSEQGTGERFTTAEGDAALQVYSFANTSKVTPEEFLRTSLVVPREQLTYERVTSSFFAISSIRDETIHYSRCNFGRGKKPVISCVDLQYPADQKQAWDRTVTRISRSLRAPED
jgi:hypothetical protein